MREMQVESWFSNYRIPVGKTMKDLMDALQQQAFVFDSIKATIDFLVEGLTRLLLMVPPVATVGAIALLAYWLHRSLRLSAFVVLAFFLIIDMGYWQATVQTIALIFWSATISVVIGVPIGIMAAHRDYQEFRVRGGRSTLRGSSPLRNVRRT